jgi:hypothetical protein
MAKTRARDFTMALTHHVTASPKRPVEGKRAHAGGGTIGPGDLTHHVTKTPQTPVKGANTRTNRQAMSTSEYSGHMRRIK